MNPPHPLVPLYEVRLFSHQTIDVVAILDGASFRHRWTRNDIGFHGNVISALLPNTRVLNDVQLRISHFQRESITNVLCAQTGNMSSFEMPEIN